MCARIILDELVATDLEAIQTPRRSGIPDSRYNDAAFGVRGSCRGLPGTAGAGTYICPRTEYRSGNGGVSPFPDRIGYGIITLTRVSQSVRYY